MQRLATISAQRGFPSDDQTSQRRSLKIDEPAGTTNEMQKAGFISHLITRDRMPANPTLLRSAPYFPVHDVERTAEFYNRVLAFAVNTRLERRSSSRSVAAMAWQLCCSGFHRLTSLCPMKSRVEHGRPSSGSTTCRLYILSLPPKAKRSFTVR